MTSTAPERLHALDAVRGFALLLGVVLHATMSFLPGFGAVGWPIADNSPSVALGVTFYVIHMFRMTTFFLIAGFFGHMVFHRRGARAFIRNRSIRILVPLVVGWIVVMPLIIVSFVWAASKSGAPLAPPPPPPGGYLNFPLTHLWFLYVLALMYAVTLVARGAFERWVDSTGAVRARIDRWVRALVNGPLAPAVLAAPIMVALYATPQWVRWFGIPTPDQSLIPNLPAAAAFGTAFAFGWVLHRQVDLLTMLERRWALHLAVALAMTAASLWLVGFSPVFVPDAPSRVTLIYSATYTLGTWTWTFAIIGAALRFLGGASPVRRYLSDASYWIYIIHLPLVFLLQTAVMDLPWHWSIKFPLILAAALVLLFGSYQAIRRTFIGEVLNGRRYTSNAPDREPEPTGGSRDVRPDSAPLAQLVEARKKYGTTVALDGLSLDVRPGELLAVLGPNGAGKSTAISLLLGLQQPDAGSAMLFGESPERVEVRYGVGVMMQEVALAPELRVREHIDLVTSYYPAPMTADEAMALTHTAALANRPYGKLSAGQKRQAQFAIAVCGRPVLLFLDEPTVGLDIQARELLWVTLRQLVANGASIVLTTHYLEEAEALADRVAVLAKGRLIASGTVEDMRSLVDRKRIRCVTSLTADDIRSWPGIVSVTATGDRLQIVAIDADAVVRRLLAADDTARDLEVQRAGLAEAFAELTQDAA